MSKEQPKIVTAGIVIIGDEILSGRTQDTNISYLANWLGEIGIQVREVRVVPDVTEKIVEAVNTFRTAFDYVFTTGGIGPTHDDITADSIGAAFGVEVEHHPDAVALLTDHYGDDKLNEARLRMARVPVGATLIDNPISKAPGFKMDNVFVMAGVPIVMQAMLDSVRGDLTGGPPVRSISISAKMAEGQVAESLGTIQERYSNVSIGSYPFYRGRAYGVSVVLRSIDERDLEAAADEVVAMIKTLGVEAHVERL